jgi:hypothetical protein
VGSLSAAHAHHVGVFTPKDDSITKNFKDIKFASQAGRFEVALRLFDDGAVHATMEKFDQALPPGLEDGLRAALKAQNLPGAELRLALFLAFMTRDRIRSAVEKLEDQRLEPEQRRDQARKLVNAAWRYYNLADFVISRQDPKASVILRTSFEDAQTSLASKLAGAVGTAGTTPPRAGPDEGKALAALAVTERTLGEVIRAGACVARRGAAKEFLPQR